MKNYRNKIISAFLIIALLVGVILPEISVKAATKKMGTVTAESLTFRDAPSLDGTIIGYLSKGDSAEILDEATDDRSVAWYKMTIDGLTGWASSSYISVTEVEIADSNEGNTGGSSGVLSDEEFEDYLTEEGFPESYKAQLRELHKMYPNWMFEAQQVSCTWNEAIEGESKLGVSLVSSGSVTSWKSTQTGAYDWETGKWVELDSGGWVQASEEIIAYYMDPRNFLDKTNIFQFLKQSYVEDYMSSAEIAAKKSDLTRMVSGSFLAGTYKDTSTSTSAKSYIDNLMDIAGKSGVDPLMLASMIMQEQGRTGSGSSISGTVSGYENLYNYFNIGAYKTSTMSAVQRGLWYAKGENKNLTSYNRPWNTRTKSMLGGALYYGNNYVSVGQDTMYLKRFNVQGSNMFKHQYMTNVQGGASEGQHVAAGYDETARQAALIFKIPVFKDMPSAPAVKPTGNKNPNYMLKSLSVSGYNLTPTFDLYETEYAVTVENGISSINISAATIASTTTVSGTGTKSLNVGTNKFTIVSTAENGDSRTYTLTVVRKATSNTGSVGISTSTYKINGDNTITGIKTFPVKAGDFIAKFTITNGTAKVLNEDGSAVSGNVGTGDQVKVYDVNGNCKYTYNVIIYGDANGDGNINARDLLAIQKNNINVSVLSGMKLAAADVNKDGKVNARDLLAVQKNNINVSIIEQ